MDTEMHLKMHQETPEHLIRASIDTAMLNLPLEFLTVSTVDVVFAVVQ